MDIHDRGEPFWRKTLEDYGPTVYRFFLRGTAGDKDASEDYVSDVFEILWRRSKVTVEITERLALSVAFLVLKRRQRDWAVHARLETQNHVSVSAGVGNSRKPDTPEESHVRAEMLTRVLKVLDSLPRNVRECWILHRFHELSIPETADAMGTSLTTAKTRIHRADQALESLREAQPKMVAASRPAKRKVNGMFNTTGKEDKVMLEPTP